MAVVIPLCAPVCLQEYQSCNTLPCPDLKKTTPWTPWTPVNISDNGGHYEQRFRYTCKARVPDPALLEVGRQRIEMRYCSSDGSTGCSTDGEERAGQTGPLRLSLTTVSFLCFSCLCFVSLPLSPPFYPGRLFCQPANSLKLNLSLSRFSFSFSFSLLVKLCPKVLESPGDPPSSTT